MDVLRWIALSAVAFAPFAAWAEGDGLAAEADRVPWARFQGRVAYATTSPLLRSGNSPSMGRGCK